MRAIVALFVMIVRPILGIALLMLSCFAILNRTLTVKDVLWSLTVGAGVFVVIEGLGVLMTGWYSLRHGPIPEGASREPIDEFDVFR